MLRDLYLISSTALIISCFLCSIYLWLVGGESRAKKCLSVILALLGLVSINVTLKTGFGESSNFELFDFIYSLLSISIVYAAYLYFKSLMQPNESLRPIIRQGIRVIGVYLTVYLLSILWEGGRISLYSTADLRAHWTHPQLWIRMAAFVHYCIFLVWRSVDVMKMYLLHKKQIADIFSYREQISLSWIPYLLAVFCTLEVGAIFDIGLPWKGGYLHAVSNFFYTLFYYSLTFAGARQSDIYSKSEVAWQKEQAEQTGDGKSHIPSAVRKSIVDRLQTLMNEEAIYRNADLRIDGLAKELATNRTYLSYIIKDDFNNNFIGLVNHYRISEATRLLQETEDKPNIALISEQVGFKSVSSFIIFFKKHNKYSPLEYWKRYQTATNL